MTWSDLVFDLVIGWSQDGSKTVLRGGRLGPLLGALGPSLDGLGSHIDIEKAPAGNKNSKVKDHIPVSDSILGPKLGQERPKST